MRKRKLFAPSDLQQGAESRAKNLLVLEKQMNQIGNISSHREVSLYIGGYTLKF